MIFPKTLKNVSFTVTILRDMQNMERAQTMTTMIFRYIKNMTSGNVQRKLDGRKDTFFRVLGKIISTLRSVA